jgi:hypothetical protein
MKKCKCKRCGAVMNIPRSYADICAKCSDEIDDFKKKLDLIQEKWEVINGVDVSDVLRDVKKILGFSKWGSVE